MHFETQLKDNFTVFFFLFFSRDHVLTVLHSALIFVNVNKRVTRHA